MKKYIYKLLTFCVLATSFGCADEDVTVQTLSKFGEQFYFNEKVVVYAGTETKNLTDVIYTWECDGGSFSGPQNLFENVWTAPNTPGEYIVKVTASVGKKSSTRQTKMKVSYFFQENFDNANNYAGFLANASNVNATITYDLTQSKAKCVANSATGYGAFFKTFLNPLNIPFSVFSNAGFDKYSTTATTYLRYQLMFKMPADLASPYIREIRWQFLPKATGTTKNMLIQYETFQPNIAKSVWTPILADDIYPTAAMNVNEYQDFSMSIGTDTIFHAYKAGVEVSNSDMIRTWLRAHPNEKPICNQIQWTFPGSTNMWFDNFYIVNTGAILTTKPE